MSSHSHPSRFALFPQHVPAESKGKGPTIRRYSLTRLTSAAPRDQRFNYLKTSHE